MTCQDCIRSNVAVASLYVNLTAEDYRISRVPSSHASWKVTEFKKGIFQAWKFVENDCGHGNTWKSHGIPLIGHGIF